MGGAEHHVIGVALPLGWIRRRVRAVAALVAFALFAVIIFVPDHITAQTTPHTVVTITSVDVVEGTTSGQHYSTLEYVIKVDRPDTGTDRPFTQFFIDWTADRSLQSDKGKLKNGTANLTGSDGPPNEIYEHKDVEIPTASATGAASVTTLNMENPPCDDGFCGRFTVGYVFANAAQSTATVKIKTVSDRFDEVDEDVTLDFKLVSAGVGLAGVQLKGAREGDNPAKKVTATIKDDDGPLPKIYVAPENASTGRGRGLEGDSGTGTNFGAVLVLNRSDEDCVKRTIADVEWKVAGENAPEGTVLATNPGKPFADFSGPTSGTLRFDLPAGDPNRAGITGCSQTKRVVLRTVPDQWSEPNETVRLAFSVKDSFPGALLHTSIFGPSLNDQDQYRRNAIISPYIEDDDPEAGVVTITPSVDSGSSLTEGTSVDKTTGGKVDFTFMVHRAPPPTTESGSRTQWQLGWRLPLSENTVDLKGTYNVELARPVADQTRDVWVKVPAITNPPIKIYNRAFQTLSFAANSPTATARLTLHVNPDGEDESAEKVTIRFTPGVGTIHGQKMSLSGGKPHLDFSYTVEDDDEPAGRILVEAPADGTVVTEGNSDSEAGEIRLRLTAHRSLAEAAATLQGRAGRSPTASTRPVEPRRAPTSRWRGNRAE